MLIFNSEKSQKEEIKAKTISKINLWRNLNPKKLVFCQKKILLRSSYKPKKEKEIKVKRMILISEEKEG